MLEKYRGWAGTQMDRFARPFLSWSPNGLSWASMVLSAIAGLFFASLRLVGPVNPLVPLFFFEAASFVFVGGFFDALDGYVARKKGLSSKRGDFLDHVLDRYADTVILLGISFSTWANPYLGLLALVSMLLSSYMGTQAQAVSGKRIYGGVLGRADRIVLVTLAAFVLFLLTLWNLFVPASLRLALTISLFGVSLGPLDLLLLYFLVAGQATAIYRAAVTWGDLRGK
jgi:archaetidylinositol phosphate synthase